MRTQRLLRMPVLLAWVWLMVGGCGKDSDAPEYLKVEGRVSSINEKTGVVTLTYFHPKKKQQMEFPGTLAPDAEIMINGRTARLDEIYVGDRVQVSVRDEKYGDQHRYVATSVEVTRPESAPGEAATQPGEASSKTKE